MSPFPSKASTTRSNAHPRLLCHICFFVFINTTGTRTRANTRCPYDAKANTAGRRVKRGRVVATQKARLAYGPSKSRESLLFKPGLIFGGTCLARGKLLEKLLKIFPGMLRLKHGWAFRESFLWLAESGFCLASKDFSTPSLHSRAKAHWVSPDIRLLHFRKILA